MAPTVAELAVELKRSAGVLLHAYARSVLSHGKRIVLPLAA